MIEHTITKENVNEIFTYCNDTGKLYWSDARHLIKAGDPVGYVTPKGYLRLSYKGKNYFVHRVVWLLNIGDWPTNFIDHINGIPDDNRLDNLRDVTIEENNQNIIKPRGKNKVVGVSFYPKTGTYRVDLYHKGKRYRLQSSKDFFDAACIRKSAENKYRK